MKRQRNNKAIQGFYCGVNDGCYFAAEEHKSTMRQQ